MLHRLPALVNRDGAHVVVKIKDYAALEITGLLPGRSGVSFAAVDGEGNGECPPVSITAV